MNLYAKILSYRFKVNCHVPVLIFYLKKLPKRKEIKEVIPANLVPYFLVSQFTIVKVVVYLEARIKAKHIL